MPDLVRADRRRGDRGAVVDGLGEVDGAMARVVVVRERPTLRPLDRDLLETVAVEDLPRDLCAGQAAHHLDLRLRGDGLPQPALDDEAQDQRRDQEHEIEPEAFHAGSVATPFPA